MKVFRGRKGNEGDKSAFADLNSELADTIAGAMRDNAGNSKYQQFVTEHGEAPVIFRRQEKGSSASAEWRGAIHVYDSPFWKGEGTDPLVPGQATSGGIGGYAAIIRHEYGHKLYGKLTPQQEQEWRSLVPDSEQVRKGLTSYGATNKEEAFCELFAVTTDPRYAKGIFPSWVDDLKIKQEEWFLKK
jgi:hypothetical protein